jgi:hypothetical protein
MTLLSNAPIVISYQTAAGTALFPTETRTTSFEARPVPDAANRTVAYVRYTIGLSATIATANQQLGQTTDATLASMRQIMTAPAGVFTYTGVGSGPLVVNAPGGPRDVRYGPWPRLLRYRPSGANQSAEVDWQIEVAVPECPLARYEGVPLEFNWKANVKPDRGDGFSQAVVAELCGLTVYGCHWRLRYLLGDVPRGGIQAPNSVFDGN